MKSAPVLLLLLLLFSCQKEEWLIDTPTCPEIQPQIGSLHPSSNALQALLEGSVQEGIPGISAILYHPSAGLFMGTAGVSSIEQNTELLTCHVFPSASISKMYAAVLSLSLHDQGILDIDDLIANHLDSDLVSQLPNGTSIRLKHLMNHSSGLPEHENSLDLTFDAFHNPRLTFSSDQEYLPYIFNKKPLFPAGEGARYSTSGVIVEDLVLEAITGQPHAELFDQIITQSLDVQQTHFSNSPGYPFPEGIINQYWDVYGNGQLINSNSLSNSIEHEYYLGSSKVIFTAYDLFLFMKAVFEDHHFFSEQSLNLMKEINFQENSTTDGYGLGLEIKISPEFGKRYGHQGGSIGVANHVYWYENGGIIVLLTNVAGFFSSPLIRSLASEEMGDPETLLGQYERILLK
ncbi:MAG: serine hydrolase [Bacteroidota bacterium]